jgi:DNA polymerase-3 subunit gamma/tau
MRDALSLLDQVIAFSGTEITTQSVRESIGLIEGQTLLGIIAGVFSRKPLEALALVDQAFQRGHDLRVLTRNLIEFLHGAVLAKIGAAGSGSLELNEGEWKELQAIAEQRSLEEIELIFQVLHHGLDWVARSPQPKVILDVLLVKCATAEALVYLDEAPTKPQAMAPKPVAPQAAAPAAHVKAPEVKPEIKPEPKTEAKALGPLTWENFIEHVRTSRPLLASILEHGNYDEAAGAIYFNPKDAYYKEQLQSRVYSEQLGTLSREYFGKPGKIQVEFKETGESPAARKEREQQERLKLAREKAAQHPMILEAKSLFGGELGPIQWTEGDHANP